MKKMLTLMVMLTVAMTMFAKDIKTVVFTTQPQMHCENCENKIKGNLKFEKGVKEVETNVAEQTVTIKYDADKTTPEKLAEAFTKFNYKATQVGCQKEAKGCQKEAKGCQKEAKGCQKEAKGCQKEVKGCQKEAAAKQEGCCGKCKE